MNLANRLTIIRILIVPVFMVLFLVRIPGGEWFAAGVFALAAMTDGLDGWIARSRNQVTTMGKLLDPLADKLLISAALITLVSLKPTWALHPWIATLIISRELAVTGLRMVAVGEGKVIHASGWGKSKTIFQVLAVIVWMVRPRFADLPGPTIAYEAIAFALMGVAVLLTIVSGIVYFIAARDVLVVADGDQ